VVVVLWAVDHGGTTSRELMLSAGRTSYGLFFDGDNLFCGAFGLHSAGGFRMSIGTDHRYTRSLYCILLLNDRHRVWRHVGGFGTVSVKDRPADELFRRFPKSADQIIVDDRRS